MNNGTESGSTQGMSAVVGLTIWALAILSLAAATASARFIPLYGAGVPDYLLAVFGLLVIAAIVRFPSSQPSLVVVSVTLTAGLLLRAATVFLFRDAVPTSDPAAYGYMADHLLRHAVLTADAGAYGHDVRAYYPPLYAVLLAASRLIFGPGIAATVGLNLAFDAAGSLLMWRVARTWLEPRAALAAGSLYFLFPAFILSVASMQKEGLVLALILALVLAWTYLREGKRWIAPAMAMGVATGLLGLAQPAIITLAPLLLFALAVREPARAPSITRAAALALVTSVLVLSPWWVRNWLTFGRFVPLTDGMGVALAVAVHGSYPALSAAVADLPEPERFLAVGRMAWAELAASPLSYARHLVVRVGAAMINNDDAGQRFGFGAPTALRPLVSPIVLMVQLSYAATLLLAARALHLHRTRLGATSLPDLIGVFIAQIMVFGIWVEFSERHRIYTLIVQIALAAFWLSGTIKPPRTALRGSANPA